MEQYVLGIDFGTDSVRCIVVRVCDGETVSVGTAFYPRWQQGLYQHPERLVFRQHPLDFIEALESCVRSAVDPLTEVQRNAIVGIGIDTTGSTPAPVDENGIPLALLPQFAENENAMFWLWKDHSSAAEADEINDAFMNVAMDYGKYQGKYSSEWFWAKILHCVRTDAAVKAAAYTWVEHCDWITAELCGRTHPNALVRSACAAGHKALWHSEWNGLPDDDTLKRLDPYLCEIKKCFSEPQNAFAPVGRLTREWAARLHLPEGITVSGCSFDAHAGAVGAGICEGTMVCTVGTSAVSMIVAKPESLSGSEIRRFCGQAENSILPNLIGVETGQAAFGDIFAWFKRLLLWPTEQLSSDVNEALRDHLLSMLEAQAQTLPDEPFPIALDWFNGRRYPDTNDMQRAAIIGLSLGTDAPTLYRSLIFGAVCGLKRIVDGLTTGGVRIDRVRVVGGISKKSPFVMQMMADLLEREIVTLDSEQTCALGAAMYAAVGSGACADVQAATERLSARELRVFRPQAERSAFYREKYREYLLLAEAAEKNFALM